MLTEEKYEIECSIENSIFLRTSIRTINDRAITLYARQSRTEQKLTELCKPIVLDTTNEQFFNRQKTGKSGNSELVEITR